MIIKFNEIEEKVINNFYDGEKCFTVKTYLDDNNRIMLGKLGPGASIGYHKHETSSEIIYVLKGKGKVIFEEEILEINENECHYCPKGKSHSLINNSNDDLVFFAVVPKQ